MDILNTCAEALRRHRFEVTTVRNTDEALSVLQAAVAQNRPQTVGFGESATLRATGFLEWVRAAEGIRLLDGFDPALPRQERMEIRRQALLSDLFVTGINALTLDGTLLWMDKTGNRIAPLAFGPRKVILVAGRNKIVADRAAAEERIRTIAAPQNAAGHPEFRTPCVRTGRCADCDSPDRLCNTRMEMLRCQPAGRIKIVLIDQNLGL